MVNLTFYRLDVPYLIISDNSEAHIFYFHFPIPSAGRSFMLEFLFWSFKGICFGAFQIACGLFGHLLFGFRFQERSAFLLILRVNQYFRWSWIMIRYAGCFGIMMDFFKQPQASVQIAAMKSFELFGFFWLFRLILFTSLPSYYFDLKSVWLPYFPFAFGSPPEDYLFGYLLFVTIR